MPSCAAWGKTSLIRPVWNPKKIFNDFSTLFSQSLHIKLALPQAAWLRVFFEGSSVVLQRLDGSELRPHYWEGREEKKKGQRPAGLEPKTSLLWGEHSTAFYFAVKNTDPRRSTARTHHGITVFQVVEEEGGVGDVVHQVLQTLAQGLQNPTVLQISGKTKRNCQRNEGKEINPSWKLLR